MIHGFQIDIAGAQLKTLLDENVAKWERKVTDLKNKMETLSARELAPLAEKLREEDVDVHLLGPMRMADPLGELQTRLRVYNERAETFAFFSTYVNATEVYRLGPSDLAYLDLAGNWGSAFPPPSVVIRQA